MINVGLCGAEGTAAVYLVQGEKTCLIDGGTRTEAGRIVQTLRALGAHPPDMIISRAVIMRFGSMAQLLGDSRGVRSGEGFLVLYVGQKAMDNITGQASAKGGL